MPASVLAASTMSINHADLIVVGGGVIGCAIAYEAALNGLKVAVLEKDRIGEGASRAAAGMLAPVAERIQHDELAQFACTSHDLFPGWSEQLWELSQVDLELRLRGIHVPVMKGSDCTAIGLQLRKAVESHPNGINYGLEWIDNSRLQALPYYHDSAIEGVYMLPKEGHLSPIKLMEALFTASKKLGVQFHEHEQVVDFLIENGRIQGVRTGSGSWYSDHVLICSGLDSNMLTDKCGISLPLHPVKGELAVVRSKLTMSSVMYGDGVYIVPKGRGRIFIGATSYPNRYDKIVEVGSVMKLMEKACRCIPELEHSEWEQAWSGLRPATADGLPFMGPISHIKGLWIAAGHFRNGILLSAATAIGMTRWLLKGEVPWMWMEAFNPERSKATQLVGTSNY
ncbi:glycine oxidase ThiO [Paenibacillus sp. ACRRX]|uniref:glycine oxidase ThiO n=1 Tax=Paenibacillus sp. ACRRX TaxID=2918206 RepID=UPI001EF64284|nr:glycine oxidase ThiO [Paenibacillus sp. ACRRX]MCG7407152.1 glycine oxidase ThiO [Paenibacillus sp. ACRRX]